MGTTTVGADGTFKKDLQVNADQIGNRGGQHKLVVVQNGTVQAEATYPFEVFEVPADPPADGAECGFRRLACHNCRHMLCDLGLQFREPSISAGAPRWTAAPRDPRVQG